jgi:hypothetical protein
MDLSGIITTRMLSIVFALLLGGPIQAQQAEHQITEITVHTHQWDGFTNIDGTGLYDETFKALFEPEGIKINMIFVPYETSLENVRNKVADVALSVYLSGAPGVLFPEWPQEVERTFVLHRNSRAYEDPRSLEGSKVAWVRGYDFDRFLTGDFEIVRVSSEAEGLRKLLSEEVEFFIDYEATIRSVAKKSGIDLQDFRLTEVVTLSRRVYPVFRDDERGRRICEIYDRRMQVLHENGKLSLIFSRHGVDDYPVPPPGF